MKLKPKRDPALHDKEYRDHMRECYERRIEMHKALFLQRSNFKRPKEKVSDEIFNSEIFDAVLIVYMYNRAMRMAAQMEGNQREYNKHSTLCLDQENKLSRGENDV